VPYFSLKELHPICPEYIQYAEDWKRTVDSKGSIIHNYVGSGEFGAQMCLRSGWLDFRKASIDLVLSKHNFDGVYYDWVSALYCNNPQHLEGKKHNDVRELLDLIFWTRKRVGPNGLVFLHLSGVPMMVIENVTDFVFTHEELNMLAPGPGEFSPETDFAGITTHHIVESKATDTLEKKIRFAIGCFLEGFWITPAVSISAEDLSFQMTKKLTQYDITTYSFIPAREKPVWIKGDGLMASFYWKKGKAIIHLANLGHQSSDSLFGIDLRDKGFSAGATIEVFSDGKVVFNTDLTTFAENGIPVRVDPLQTLFFEIWEK